MLKLDEIRVGNPVQHAGLSLFPLFAWSDRCIEYQLSHEALAAGSIAIEEVSEAGSVGTLLVRNRGDSRVLFLEGEELVGAKQNRVLNTSVMVPARSKIRIPVSCVERGRWRYQSRRLQCSGSHSSPRLRGILGRSTHRSLRAQRGHVSDQRNVWKEVGRQQNALCTASETIAMSDTFQTCEDQITEFRERLRYVQGATGVAVAVGGRMVVLDLFDKPATCERVWDRLLSGFALDALERERHGEQADVADARGFLSILLDARWEKVDSAGEGEEHRARTDAGDHIFRLSLEGSTVHACVVSGEA